MSLELLAMAYEKRKRVLTDSNAFRLLGSAEGIQGLVIEVFGEVAIFQVHEGRFQEDEAFLRGLADWCASHLSIKSVYVKRFIPDRSHAKEDPTMKSEKPFWGSEAPSEFSIEEWGVKYAIRPFDGYSVGLFLDQRNNRTYVHNHSHGKEVLNLFSYTCAFSVGAAKGGGTVTSIDTSKKYLEWGRRNFKLNGLSLEPHRFIAEDVMLYLKRQAKKGKKYDVVIVDPPSFGRSKEGIFSLKQDWKELLVGALAVLHDKGTLLFSCNLSLWDESEFKRNVQKALGDAQFKEIQIEKPLDFSYEIQGLNQIVLKEVTL